MLEDLAKRHAGDLKVMKYDDDANPGRPIRPTTYRWRSAQMKGTRKGGPGPSHALVTPDHAGNVVGIDPHRARRRPLRSVSA